MSKIIKCDICGKVIDPTIDPCRNYRVAVEERQWIKTRMEWVPIDVCFGCLRLLRDKAKEVQKND